ncbi:MAG: hypothetical protein HW387_1152 [Parachlamydiales bacterium]|nr:hypothetical protein [Parachlamydiales bacterium]
MIEPFSVFIFPAEKGTREEILPQTLSIEQFCWRHQNCKIHPIHNLLKQKALFKNLLRVVLVFRRKRVQRECLDWEALKIMTLRINIFDEITEGLIYGDDYCFNGSCGC